MPIGQEFRQMNFRAERVEVEKVRAAGTSKPPLLDSVPELVLVRDLLTTDLQQMLTHHLRVFMTGPADPNAIVGQLGKSCRDIQSAQASQNHLFFVTLKSQKFPPLEQVLSPQGPNEKLPHSLRLGADHVCLLKRPDRLFELGRAADEEGLAGPLIVGFARAAASPTWRLALRSVHPRIMKTFNSDVNGIIIFVLTLNRRPIELGTVMSGS